MFETAQSICRTSVYWKSVKLVFLFIYRMSFQDFAKNFSKLEICNLGPDSATDTTKKRFQESVHEGCWKRRVNAGGCRNYLSQYRSPSASAFVSEVWSLPLAEGAFELWIRSVFFCTLQFADNHQLRTYTFIRRHQVQCSNCQKRIRGYFSPMDRNSRHVGSRAKSVVHGEGQRAPSPSARESGERCKLPHWGASLRPLRAFGAFYCSWNTFIYKRMVYYQYITAVDASDQICSLNGSFSANEGKPLNPPPNRALQVHHFWVDFDRQMASVHRDTVFLVPTMYSWFQLTDSRVWRCELQTHSGLTRSTASRWSTATRVTTTTTARWSSHCCRKRDVSRKRRELSCSLWAMLSTRSVQSPLRECWIMSRVGSYTPSATLWNV